MSIRRLTAVGFVVVAGASLGAGLWLDSARAAAPASALTPITPCRLLDTREGTEHVGGRTGALGPNETVNLVVVGANGECDIPGDATAISANVTVVAPTANSYLTIFPSGGSAPKASNLNWVAGQAPTANQVIVGLGAGGVSVLNRFGSVHVIIDIVGYYTPSAGGAGSGLTSPNGQYSISVTNAGISLISGGTEVVRISGTNVNVTGDNIVVTSALNTSMTAGLSTAIVSGVDTALSNGRNLDVTSGINTSITTGNNLATSVGKELSVVSNKATTDVARFELNSSGPVNVTSGANLALKADSATSVSSGTDVTIVAGRSFAGHSGADTSITSDTALTIQSASSITIRASAQVRILGAVVWS